MSAWSRSVVITPLFSFMFEICRESDLSILPGGGIDKAVIVSDTGEVE